ncbi:MAG TPA: DUF4058 family protein [Candidatus Xenobia bacterium]
MRFPGMDPFIEGQMWNDFQMTFAVALRAALVTGLRPRYVARLKVRTYREASTEEQRERLIEIGTLGFAELYTVIEILSPLNKRAGSIGREQYMTARHATLAAGRNLVEVDLLRGGERVSEKAAGDYLVLLHRSSGPSQEWPIHLGERLPTLSIPLAPGSEALAIDLQSVFDTVYLQAGYDYALDRSLPISPPLTTEQQRWAVRYIE